MNNRPVIAGVCQSVAKQLGLDVRLVRAAMAISTLAWGAGALLYLALWFLRPLYEGQVQLPRAGGWGSYSQRRLEQLRRLRQRDHRRPLGALMVVGGGVVLLRSSGVLAFIDPMSVMGAAAILLGASVFWTASSHSKTER